MDRRVTEALIRKEKQGGTAELVNSPQSIYVYFLKPNLESYTPESPQQELRELEELAQVTVEKGSVLVAEGEIVDRRVKEQLEAVRPHLLEHRFHIYTGLGVILLVSFTLMYLFMQRFAPQLTSRTATLTQLSIIFLIFLAMGLFLGGKVPVNFFYFGVVFAVVSLASLVTLIYDAIIGLLLALILGYALSVALEFGTGLMLYTMAGALLPSVYLMSGSSRRSQVSLAFLMGLNNLIFAVTATLISAQHIRWEILLIAFLAGFAAVVVALGLLPIVESITTTLTPGKLIELANPENKLLKRLKREALGTYAHSQMVADLAEEACKDVGLDWLLARVGALYHDIGKIKRPGFFAENIHDLQKNPHQGLPAETSAKILKDHVTDGLIMAREANLPRELHQFIAEHHGTYLIKYFYFLAERLHERDPEKFPEPDRELFCYDGPIPQNRESGVVMLADITEAITRSKPEADLDEVREIVDQVVADKIEEKQLVDSGLTLGDLSRIKEAFNRILAARRHHRPSYPGKPPTPVHFHFLGKSIPGEVPQASE